MRMKLWVNSFNGNAFLIFINEDKSLAIIQGRALPFDK
jgi:hypothetical protein